LTTCGFSANLFLIRDEDLKEVSRVAKDPVCSMNVDEKNAAATSVYKDETYYFCVKCARRNSIKTPKSM
jgi:YHS domain-containing protein